MPNQSIATSPEKRPAGDMLPNEAKYQRTSNDSNMPQRRPSMHHQQHSEYQTTSQVTTGPMQYPNSGGPPHFQPLHIPPQAVKAATRSTTSTPTSNLQNLTLHSPYPQSPIASAPLNTNTTGPSANVHQGVPIGARKSQPPAFSNSQYQSFELPQPAFPHLNPVATSGPQNGYINAGPITSSLDQATIAAVTGSTMGDWDPMASQFTVPVFGETYSRSPQWGQYAPDFLDLLMGPGAEMNQNNGNSYFPGHSDQHNAYNLSHQFPNTYYGIGLNAMQINTIAPKSPPRESLLSEDKRQQLIFVIDSLPDIAGRFPGGIASGPASEEDHHPLSLNMMQTFIQLYWQHFHPQLPILHRPTFSADKTPDILLLCIMVIGMACMEFKADPTLAQEAVDLAKQITKSLRWSIFSEDDFRPPAKLWVFQALLLLETFEKMYADRRLHERAHIHHATTLTLMRRGSSLTGRSGAYDSPQSGRDAGSEGSGIVFSGQPGAGTGNTSDEAWNRWIVGEATKRVAFAAFVLDSTHATMFGHSAVMVAHEMRLHLPCDETLWAATSASEVFNIQQSLTQNNAQPPTFLEGLRATLTGRPVNTNSFGRTVLMAGLLSVGWHLHQRDLQISSLSIPNQLGGKDKWRSTLTHSFDHWKKDFDESLAKLRRTDYGPITYSTEDVEHENIFESRTVLHHLAHMSMHVEIVDLQIYAGARRLLGRAITKNDAEATRKKIKAWAPTARARDAVFYAFRFLSQVLLPEERSDMATYNRGPDDLTDGKHGRGVGHRRPSEQDSRKQHATATTTGVPIYSARDDHLLNRPWVLYYASLVVWSYGYALEGPIPGPKPVPVPATPEESYASMREFLRNVGGVDKPEELQNVKGRNMCLGLLVTLQGMFSACRWELLGEASKLLKNATAITAGEVVN